MKYQLTVVKDPAVMKKQVGGLRALHGLSCPVCKSGEGAGAFSGWVGKKFGFHFMCLVCRAEFMTLSQTMHIEPWQQGFELADFDQAALRKMNEYFLEEKEACKVIEFKPNKQIVKALEEVEAVQEHQEEDIPASLESTSQPLEEITEHLIFSTPTLTSNTDSRRTWRQILKTLFTRNTSPKQNPPS